MCAPDDRSHDSSHLENRVCDAHIHLWDDGPRRYLWSDLARDIALLPTDSRAVYVECGSHYWERGPLALRCVGETEWAGNANDKGQLLAAIVGSADLTLGDLVRPVLAEHASVGRGLFRGVRVTLTRTRTIAKAMPDCDETVLRDFRFRRGVDALADLDLVLELWAHFDQLPELIDFARRVPQVRIVIDHLGGPRRADRSGDIGRAIEQWRASLVELADCHNVALKVGGIGMPIFGMNWHERGYPATSREISDAWRADILWCVSIFGADRCMLESNFPVDLQSFSYSEIWRAYDLIADGLAAEARAELRWGTAARIYKV
jgi:L-fuconolactonase